MRVDLPPFTLVAATTEGGRVPPPLRSRFVVHEVLERYDARDLADLARGAAAAEDVRFDEEAAIGLARCARGTPREALRLTDRVIDQACVHRWASLDRETMQEALATLGYDREGLGPFEQRYVDVLRATDGPMAIARLAMALGMDVRSVEREVEPELLRRGLVRVTPYGRVAVDRSKARVMGPKVADVRQLWSRVPFRPPAREA